MRVDDNAVLDDVGGGPPWRKAALPLLSLRRDEHASDDGHRGGARQPHDPHGARGTSGGGHDGGDGGRALSGRHVGGQPVVLIEDQGVASGREMGLCFGGEFERGREEGREFRGSEVVGEEREKQSYSGGWWWAVKVG